MLNQKEIKFIENAKNNQLELPNDLKEKLMSLASDETSVCCKIFSGGASYVYKKVSPSIYSSLAGDVVSDDHC